MSARFVLLLVLFLLPLHLSGCGIVQNLASKSAAKRRERAMEKLADSPEAKARGRAAGRALGEVTWVDISGGFVLIRVSSGAGAPPGTMLECRRGSVRAARVVITPERQPPFLAADIVAGEPQTGDSVVLPNAPQTADARLVPVKDSGAGENPAPAGPVSLPPMEPLPHEPGQAGKPGLLTEDDVLGPRDKRAPAATPGTIAPDNQRPR